MKIAGIQKNSFVDYPGKIAAVLFTPGCNFNCFYCHNRQLIDPGYKAAYTEAEVLEFLEKRKGLIDAVVISGGEPTLQPDLYRFVEKIGYKGRNTSNGRNASNKCYGDDKDKVEDALGYSVKIDTNGARPDVIRRLLAETAENGAVDYIAMDIKAPLYMYDEICGVRVDREAIKESISLIMESGIPYEFRTTVVPQLKSRDIVEMASLVEGARLYVLQQYRKPNGGADTAAYATAGPGGDNRSEGGSSTPVNMSWNTINNLSVNTAGNVDNTVSNSANGAKIIDIRLMKAPYTKEDLEAMAASVKGIVKECIIRGI